MPAPSSSLPSSLMVYPAVRHARLTVAHAAVLFGEMPLHALHRLSNGLDAANAVVAVEGPRGRLELVRALLPAVAQSIVYLTAADADAVGLVGLSTSLSSAPGCTLIGPHGTVVLASCVLACERVVLPASTAAAARSLRADVQIDGERPRVLRGVPVEAGEPTALYVVDTELKAGTTAHLI